MLSLQVLVMVWFGLGGAIGSGLIGPNRVAIQEEFGLGVGQFGIGLAAVQLGVPAIILTLSPLLRRSNPVHLLMVSLVLLMGGLVLVGLTPLAVGLLGGYALIVAGLGLGAVGNNVSMDLWPSNPRRGVVLLHGVNAVGKVVGPLIVAVVIARSWRLSFLIVAGVAVLVLLAFAAMYGQTRHVYSGPRAPAGNPDPHPHDRPWLTGVYAAGMIVSFGMVAGGEFAFATLAPQYFEQVKGLSPEEAAMLLSVHLVGLMVGRFISAGLSQRVSNRAIIAVCLATGLLSIPAILTDSSGVRYASMFVMGGMFSSTWPSLYAQVSGLFAHRRELLAYGASAGTAGGLAVAALLSSLIAERSLTLSVFFGPAVLWLFGLAFFCTGLSRRRQPLP